MPALSDQNPSEKQLEVLRYIISYVEVVGLSKNAIKNRLKELARHGVIEMPASRERAIILKYVRYRAYSSSEDKPSSEELHKKIAENKNPMFMPEIMSDWLRLASPTVYAGNVNSPMNEKLFVRIGDAGDYEEAADVYDLAGALMLNRVKSPVCSYNKFGVATKEYSGNNYISLYWGENVETPTRELTEDEIKEVNRILEN